MAIAMLWGLQRRLIYFPDATPVPPAAHVIAGAREVTLNTSDGLELGAWFVPAGPVNRTGMAVLLAPGNGGDRGGRGGGGGGAGRPRLALRPVGVPRLGGEPGGPGAGGPGAGPRPAPPA